MTEAQLVAEMAKFEFTRLAELRLEAALPALPLFEFFEFDDRLAGRGIVYMWVEQNGQAYTIVYVGMTSKTIQSRCNDHVGGFSNSATGRVHAERIRAGVSEGCKYFLWARQSPVQEVLGVPRISMAPVEEQALIAMYHPPWNRRAQ